MCLTYQVFKSETMQKKTGWKALSNDGLVNPRLLLLQKLLALLVYEIMPSINAIYDFFLVVLSFF